MRKIALASTTMTALAVGFANPKGGNAAPTPAEPAAASGPTTSNARVAPELTEVLSIALPETPKSTNRGSVSAYPFDSLTEVGQFFGVKNKDKRGMSSIVSNQNKKFKVNVTDDKGNIVYATKTVTDANGAKIELPDTSKPQTTFTKKFEVIEVTDAIAAALKGTAAEGSKSLVRRTV
jgi:hypothetical protein